MCSCEWVVASIALLIPLLLLFPFIVSLSFVSPSLLFHSSPPSSSHKQVPIYTFESAGDQPDALNEIFTQQKKLFLSVAKSLNDERAVNRQGSFLKRVEVLNVGVL